MTEKVAWNLGLYIEKGPSIKLADSFKTDAYDKVSVPIPNDDTEVEVAVQPSGVGKIDFLCIISDQYSQDSTKKLAYKSGETGTTEIILDRAQVLIGASLIELLDDVPTKLTFKNSTDNPANVSILVGRKAV
jgi:hypothetical protein